MLISGYIHDVSSFVDQHPGGRQYLVGNAGREVTASFFGGVYTHSNAAHNVCPIYLARTHELNGDKLLSMLRVGILEGGVEHITSAAKPIRKLRVIEENLY